MDDPRRAPAGRRLRVLYLIRWLASDGGAERFALGLATHLPRDRFEPWVCASRGAEPEAAQILAQAGIPLVDLGRRTRWDVHRMAALPGLVGSGRFDVLHSHMFGSNVWGTVVGRACNVPVVIAHEHTWSYQGNPLRVLLDGHVVGRLATRFIAVSAADGERMVRVEGVNPEKVQVIPTAYLPRAGEDDGDVRQELGLAAGTPLYGVAAVMRPQKALDVLVQAHAIVRQAVPGAHLVIAGDGPARAQIERLLAERALGSSVSLLGRRSDVESIIRALDVAVMSSDYEGMPLFALECMANGVPLVATAVGGLRDLVVPGVTGLLVPARAPERLAAAIAELLRDGERRRWMGAAAATRVQAYRMDAVALRFASLYEQLHAQAAGAVRTPIGGLRWAR